MSTFSKTLALGLFLVLNACGASTITSSSRIEGGNGGGASLGPIVEARTPPNVEQPMFDRIHNEQRTPVRENPSFRIESDCWRCR